MIEKISYIYMMMNTWNTVIYTGVTNNLKRRVQEHNGGYGCEFTKFRVPMKLLHYRFHVPTLSLPAVVVESHQPFIL